MKHGIILLDKWNERHHDWELPSKFICVVVFDKPIYTAAVGERTPRRKHLSSVLKNNNIMVISRVQENSAGYKHWLNYPKSLSLYTMFSERKRRPPTKTGSPTQHPTVGDPVSIAGDAQNRRFLSPDRAPKYISNYLHEN